jgi:hypothetical protein
MDASGTSSNFQNESQQAEEQDEEDFEMIDNVEQAPPVMNSVTASTLLYNALNSIQQKASANGQSSGLGNVVKNWTSAIKGDWNVSLL